MLVDINDDDVDDDMIMMPLRWCSLLHSKKFHQLLKGVTCVEKNEDRFSRRDVRVRAWLTRVS